MGSMKYSLIDLARHLVHHPHEADGVSPTFLTR
jgi:hypothetical protein